MAVAQNLVGQKFGRLLVKEKTRRDKYRNSLWLCLCDCGRIKEISGRSLKTGLTKSCGCLQSEKSKITGINNWKGYGEISGYYWSDIRKSARTRNLNISISIEQAWNVFISQNRKCALSGEKLYFARNQYKDIQTASLDRINSKKEYTIDNIQWTHKDINIMKISFDQNKFLDLCHKIAFFIDNGQCRDLDIIEKVIKTKIKPGYYSNNIPIVESNNSNIIGLKFGRYTVLEQSKLNKNKYLCECECSTKKEVYLNHLKNGGTLSCGCYFKEVDYTNYHRWKGYEEISKSYWNSLRDSANRRNIDFNLSLESMWNQFVKQNRRCALTGEKICFIRNYRQKKIHQTASLDRIDSKLDYNINNIQWIHKDINKLKWNLNQEYFLILCKLVTNYNKNLKDIYL